VRDNYIMVLTDETYIHQNHSPLTSWTEDGTTGKTTPKGKRLVVLNAITMDDFVVARDAEGFPIKEESIKKGSPSWCGAWASSALEPFTWRVATSSSRGTTCGVAGTAGRARATRCSSRVTCGAAERQRCSR
jgi:hypothetical protein